MSRLDRQSFLGPESPEVLDGSTIAFVGLGGGGSHEVQQCAHLGLGGYILSDPDHIEDTNTNRLVGGTLADANAAMPKVDIASRMIRGIVPKARIVPIHGSWKSNLLALRSADVILGAVDLFSERDQLERFARQSLIPYIDIGMDVYDLKEKGFLVSGQVFLSTPSFPCMRCCGILSDERLRREAERYGAAGSRPQVVWPNGVLASTAVGLLVQLLTPWHPHPPRFAHLEYDGNLGTVVPSIYMRRAADLPACPHHPCEEFGDPMFDIRSMPKEEADVALLSARPLLDFQTRYGGESRG